MSQNLHYTKKCSVLELVRCFIAVAIGVTLVAAEESIGLSSNVTFSDDTVLCPGTLVEFECIGINLETLQWRSDQVVVVYGIDTDGELLTDVQPSQPPGYNFSLTKFDPFLGQGTRIANFTAILRVELSALTGGEQIQCLRGSSLSQSINVTYSTRNAPPAPMFAKNITRGLGSSLNLNFYWNESFTRAHAVEMYCISSVGVDCSTCVSPNTTFVCPQIMQGQATSFSVQAVNCENQQGEPMTFMVNPQVPGQTNTCSSVPVYSSEPTGDLIGIKNTWRAVNNPSVLSRNELNYTLSINDSLMKEVTLHQKEVCLPSTNQCEYVTYLSESREAQLQTIAVTVTAENVVGRGEPQPCSPTISTKNRIFETTVDRDGSRTLVQCQFITASQGAMQTCMFCYGHIEQSCEQQNVMCLPPIVVQDDRTGIASYELPDEFCYKITASVDGNITAVVSGRVEADCNTTDLGGSTVVSPPSDERCLDINAVGSVLIENGVICYNGTSTGSLVTYHCNSGYQLKDGDGMRKCQSDSNWDGQMATCSQEPCLNAARFFFALAVVVSVVTILFSSCMIYKIRSNTDKRLAGTTLGTVMLCVLLVIIFYASMEALQQNQALCVVSNLVSILSATVCLICLTLTGIMYIYAHNTDLGGKYDVENESKVQSSKPKPTGSEFICQFRDSEAFGKHPSISVNEMNSKFIVVEVRGESGWLNSDDKQRKLKYRLGELIVASDGKPGILWGDPRVKGSDAGNYYAEGRRPRVAMNKNGIVGVVHQNKRQCVYRVGIVNLESFTIEWEGDELGTVFAEEGTSPSVAIDDDDHVIMTYYNVNKGNGTTHIVNGTVGEGLAIDSLKKHTFPQTAKKLTVAVNNKGMVVVSYRTDEGIFCMAGLLKRVDCNVEWQSKRSTKLSDDVKNPHVAPVVSVNIDGNFIVTCRITTCDGVPTMVCYVGQIDTNTQEIFLAKEENGFGSGWNPAVAINSKNKFLIVHEENNATFIDEVKLYYHFGTLKLL